MIIGDIIFTIKHFCTENHLIKGVSQAAIRSSCSSFRKLWLYELVHGSNIPCEALCHRPAMQAFLWPSMLNQTVITNKSKSAQAPEGESTQTLPQSRRTLITVICNATHLTALQSGTFASTFTRARDFLNNMFKNNSRMLLEIHFLRHLKS